MSFQTRTIPEPQDGQEYLHVIVPISNPCGYKRRWELTNQFLEWIKNFPNVMVYVVELAHADRPHVITDPNNPFHIQVRGSQAYFHKEALIRIGMSYLPTWATKVAWIDADCQFTNPNWVNETLAALDHYKFLQLFSEYIDVDRQNQVIGKTHGFVWGWKNGTKMTETKPTQDQYGKGCGTGEITVGLKDAPGLAWAARLDAVNAIGGIPAWMIVGAGDWHLAYCLIGEGVNIQEDWYTDGYKLLLRKLQEDCDRYICGNVGYLENLAIHYHHGPKSKRGYGWRWGILKKYNFDPILDLSQDHQGLYVITPTKQQMIQEIAEYFFTRDEDSTERV